MVKMEENEIKGNFFVKGDFFSGDRYRVLSRPRYQPPTPVLVDSEVRGTTLQKLIVDSEVRGTTLEKS